MRRLFAISCLSLLLPACTASSPPQPHGPQAILEGPAGSITLNVEIADDDATRARGLMGRTSLAENAGMIFVFDEPKPAAFWMKNTLIPLDVIFFDAGMRFVSFSRMVPCTKDPCRTYPAAKPSLYALEVPGGFAERHGVGTGWTLTMQP